MKLLYLIKKLICLFIAITIIFQGCTVYKKASVTSEEARLANVKTMVVKKEKLENKYNRIIEIEGKIMEN